MREDRRTVMLKKILIIALVILLLAAAIVGYFLSVRSSILRIALADAGLSRSQVRDVDVEREYGVYEVDFETWEREYHYIIDANTKEILGRGMD